jgi:hypothetical protein
MLDAALRRLARLRGDTNAAVAANVGEPNTTTEVVSVMTKKQKRAKLTEDEVERQEGEPLPERTQLSTLYPSTTQPVPDDLLHLPIQPPNDVGEA